MTREYQLRGVCSSPLFSCISVLHIKKLAFLQIEDKDFHQQKDYDSLCCDTCFIVGVLEPNPQYLRGMPVPVNGIGFIIIEGRRIKSSASDQKPAEHRAIIKVLNVEGKGC